MARNKSVYPVCKAPGCEVQVFGGPGYCQSCWRRPPVMLRGLLVAALAECGEKVIEALQQECQEFLHPDEKGNGRPGRKRKS
jgi:hypothetical protein